MAWNAKPSVNKGYSYSSIAGEQNIWEITNILRGYGWTDEAIAGCIANSIYEGGLNPWRWGGDTYPPPAGLNGCGLFGFTPYTRYLNTAGADQMNMSATTITPNASPNVGAQQVHLMASGQWGWVGTCWRSGQYYPTWTKANDPYLWEMHNKILNKYGNGSRITISQYGDIDNVYYATFAFFACFEGPGRIKDYYNRSDVVQEIFNIIAGYYPSEPDEPDPLDPDEPDPDEPDPLDPDEPDPLDPDEPDVEPTTPKKGLPIYMMIRKQFRKE